MPISSPDRESENSSSKFKGSDSMLTVNTDDFIIGDRVWVNGHKPGYIQYIGETQFSKGEWAGIVLDDYSGKNDGSVSGIRYFQCEPKRGVFSRLHRLTRYPLSPTSSRNLEDMLNGSRSTSFIKSRSSLSPASSDRSTTPTRNRSLSPGVGGSRPRLADRVLVNSSSGSKTGILRYLGPTAFASGEWAGVELDEPVGKNDGSVAGKRYFQCRMKYGLFAPANKISKLLSGYYRTSGSRDSLNTGSSSITKTTRIFSTPTKVVQDNGQEKEEHIQKLLKERDLERAEVVKAASQIEQVEEQLTSMKREHNRYVSDSEKRAKHLRKLLEESERERRNIASQVQEEKRKVEDLQFQLEEEAILRGDLEEQLEKEKSNTKEIETALEVSNQKLNSHISQNNSSDRIKRRRDENHHVTNGNSEYSSVGIIGDTLMEDDREELERQKMIIKERNMELEKLKIQLQESKQKTLAAKHEISTLRCRQQEEISSISDNNKKEINTLEDKISSLQEKLVDKEISLGETMEELRRVGYQKEELQRIKEDLTSRERKIEELKEELQGCRVKLVTDAASTKSQQLELEQNQIRTNQLQRELEQSQMRMDQLQREKDLVGREQEEYLMRREKDKRDHEAALAEREALVSLLRAEVDRLQSDFRSYREDLQRKLEETKIDTSAVQDLHEELQFQRQMMDELQKQLQHADEEKEYLKTELDTYRHLEAEKLQLERKCFALESSIEDIRHTKNAANQEKDSLMSKVEQIQEDRSKESTKYQQEVEFLNSVIVDMQRKNDELKTRLELTETQVLFENGHSPSKRPATEPLAFCTICLVSGHKKEECDDYETF